MFRSILVIILIATGAYYALQAPFYGLLFYIGNAYFRPEEWVWWNWVSMLQLSFVSGAYVVLISILTGQRFIWNGRIALLWLFLLQSFFSLLGSEHFSYSWTYWFAFFKSIVISYMIVVLVTDLTRFRLMILVMVLALGMEQAKQGWFYLVTSPTWHNENPVPFLGDNNAVAIGMLGLVPLAGLLFQTTKKKWAKSFYPFLFIGCLYRALSTYSRGAFLTLLTMASVWGVRSRHKLAALVCALAISAIVIPTLSDTYWNRMGTITTYEQEEDQSGVSRIHFWTVAMRMVNANPLFGVGPFAYNLDYNSYDFSDGAYGRNRSVHSSYFGVLAELGYPGAILYILIILSALRSCSRVCKRAAGKSELSDLSKSALALQMSLIAFMFGGNFIPAQYTEMQWHIIGLTIALERIAAGQEAAIPTDQLSDEARRSASKGMAAAA